MLKIFNTNKPFILFFLPFLAVLLWLPALMDIREEAVNGMPFFNALDRFFTARYLRMILVIVVILAGGFLWNRVVARHHLLVRNTNLPATIYVILFGLTSSMVSMNPVIFANLFLIMALDRILSIYNQPRVYELSFQIGILISLAAHFYILSSFFMLLFFAALIIIRTFDWRDWVIALMGFLVPFLYSWTYHFWYDRLPEYNEALTSFSGYLGKGDFPLVLLYQKIGYLFFAGAGLLWILGQIGRETVRQKNLLSLVLICFGIAVLTFALSGVGWADIFLFSAIPLTIMLSTFFQSVKRNWLAELLFLFFIGIVAANLAFYFL